MVVTKDTLLEGVGEIFDLATDTAGGLKTELEEALTQISEICTELDPTLQAEGDDETEDYV